jgi:predicted small lipoprotein YifL
LAALVCPTVSVPKAKAVGAIVSGKFPVPDNGTVCGESGALSLMASDPVTAPATEGVNVTVTMQDAPAFSDEPQLLLAIAKFPVVVIELILTAALLVFFTVIGFAALVVLTSCGLKATLSGDGNTIGALATVNGSAANAAHDAPLGKLSTHT